MKLIQYFSYLFFMTIIVRVLCNCGYCQMHKKNQNENKKKNKTITIKHAKYCVNPQMGNHTINMLLKKNIHTYKTVS